MGTQLTAELSDLSGSISNTTWTWQRRSSPTATWQAAAGTWSQPLPWTSIYRPLVGDQGDQLRATVSYDDAHGRDQSAASADTDAVLAAPEPPEPPIVVGVVPVLEEVGKITCYVGEYCSYTFPVALEGTPPISYSVSPPSWADPKHSPMTAARHYS